eukprot:364198-Chlamydomonas_euryale.AAC.12
MQGGSPALVHTCAPHCEAASPCLQANGAASLHDQLITRGCTLWLLHCMHLRCIGGVFCHRRPLSPEGRACVQKRRRRTCCDPSTPAAGRRGRAAQAVPRSTDSHVPHPRRATRRAASRAGHSRWKAVAGTPRACSPTSPQNQTPRRDPTAPTGIADSRAPSPHAAPAHAATQGRRRRDYRCCRRRGAAFEDLLARQPAGLASLRGRLNPRTGCAEAASSQRTPGRRRRRCCRRRRCACRPRDRAASMPPAMCDNLRAAPEAPTVVARCGVRCGASPTNASARFRSSGASQRSNCGGCKVAPLQG